MPVHVPERTDVAEEPRALRAVQPPPERRRQRSQRPHDVAPVTAPCGRMAPHGREHACGRVRRLVEVRGKRREWRRRRGLDVGLREQAVARDGLERPADSTGRDVESDVHHRQPRPEHQNGFALADRVERAADPGVAHVARRLVEGAALGRRVGRRVVSESQDHEVRGPAASVGEGDRRPLLPAFDLDVAHLADDALENGVPSRVRLRGAQDVLEVLPVDTARDERAAPDRRVAPAREAQEVVGLLRQRAHAAGRDVQDVRFDPRPVGHAPPDGAVPVDEDDLRGLPAPQQVRRHGSAAEAAPDDDDRRARGIGRAVQSRASIGRASSSCSGGRGEVSFRNAA